MTLGLKCDLTKETNFYAKKYLLFKYIDDRYLKKSEFQLFHFLKDFSGKN